MLWTIKWFTSELTQCCNSRPWPGPLGLVLYLCACLPACGTQKRLEQLLIHWPWNTQPTGTKTTSIYQLLWLSSPESPYQYHQPCAHNYLSEEYIKDDNALQSLGQEPAGSHNTFLSYFISSKIIRSGVWIAKTCLILAPHLSNLSAFPGWSNVIGLDWISWLCRCSGAELKW